MPIYAGQVIRAVDVNPTTWTPVEFESPWRNYGNGWSDAQFRFIPLTSSVQIKGSIIGSTPGQANNIPSDSLAFRLPEGYGPVANLAVPIAHLSEPPSASVTLRIMRLSTGGAEARILGANALNTAAVTFDGVEFYVGE